MKFIPKNVRRYQQGGPMPEEAPMEEAPMEEAPAEGGAPMEGQGGEQDPIMMLAQAAMQALQNQDCQMAMQVCQGFIQLVQQMQGGAAPEAAAPQGEPVFRRGGVLVRRINRY